MFIKYMYVNLQNQKHGIHADIQTNVTSSATHPSYSLCKCAVIAIITSEKMTCEKTVQTQINRYFRAVKIHVGATLFAIKMFDT